MKKKLVYFASLQHYTEILLWLIEIWIKNHLVSDNICKFANEWCSYFAYKEWYIMEVHMSCRRHYTSGFHLVLSKTTRNRHDSNTIFSVAILDWYKGEYMVSIMNINNGIKEPTWGYRNCRTSRTLIFWYVKVTISFVYPVYRLGQYHSEPYWY